MNKFEDVAARIYALLRDLGVSPPPIIEPAHADDACDVTSVGSIRLRVDKGPEDLDYYARHVVGHYLGDLHAFSDVWADRVADLWALQLMHNYCPGYDQAVGEVCWCLDAILDGRDDNRPPLGRCREPWQQRRERLVTLVAGVERLQTALRQIADWARAYPLEVFPEPDLKRAAEVLKAAGLSLDAVSASAMRHVVETVAKIAVEALDVGHR